MKSTNIQEVKGLQNVYTVYISSKQNMSYVNQIQ
jgi:hypothetical protein